MSLRALEALSRIKSKIEGGIYKYENCTCYCGSEDSILLAEMDRYGNYYPLVICKKCGIIRCNPRLTNESYIDLYSYEYRTLFGDKDKDKDELYKLWTQKARKVHDFITKNIPLPSNAVIFDIGCNMGTMLLPFHIDGHVVLGVDYGMEHIEYGKKRAGLNLEVGGIKQLKKFGHKADLIILNHVFEHFLDIDKELREIREIMKSDAYLYVSVPGTFWWIENNCRGNIMELLQNAHAWQFSLTSLRYVMECSGFEFIVGNEEILSIFKKTSTLKRNRQETEVGEFEEVVRYLKHIEKRNLPKYFIIEILEILGLKNCLRKFYHCLKSRNRQKRI